MEIVEGYIALVHKSALAGDDVRLPKLRKRKTI